MALEKEWEALNPIVVKTVYEAKGGRKGVHVQTQDTLPRDTEANKEEVKVIISK